MTAIETINIKHKSTLIMQHRNVLSHRVSHKYNPQGGNTEQFQLYINNLEDRICTVNPAKSDYSHKEVEEEQQPHDKRL